jgi:hypothetical protein
MINEKAGERKRTVTVTVGPISERLMAEIHVKMLRTEGNFGVTPTSLATAGLENIIVDWCRIWKVEIPEDWKRLGH